MAGILDLLNSDLGKQIITGVSEETGAPHQKTNDVLTMAMPILLSAMRRNATETKGANNLMSALDTDHDGSILDNLQELFMGGVDQTIKTDGDKILGHVLGPKRSRVETAISQQSGINPGTIAQILQVAAPILLGLLGKEKRQGNISSQSGLDGLLGGLLKGNSSNKERSFLEAILDADGDGSIIDDVAGMVLGGNNKKQGGLGDVLGDVFRNN